jgi:hypothetical protein
VSTISSIQIDTEPIADGDADDSDDNSDDNNNNSNNNSDNNSDNSDVRGVGDDRNDSSDDGATNEADADSENDDNDSRPTDSSDKETPAAESDSGESDGSAVAPVGRIDIASTGHDTIRPVIAAQTQDTSVPAEGEPAIAQSHGHRPVATGAAAATLQADSQTASTQEVGLGTAAATTSSGDRALPVVSGALLAVTMGKPLSRLGATGDATTDGGAAEARGASGGSVAWDERRRQQRSNRVAKTKRHENDQPREDSPHREAGSDQQAGGGPIDFAADQRGSADSTPISPPAAALASSPSQSPSEWDQMEILAIASSGVTVGAVSMLAMGRSRRTQPSAGTQPIGPAYTGTTMASGGHGG